MNSAYFNSVNKYTYIYTIKPGDTLSKLIYKFYLYKFDSSGYKKALQQIMHDNPQVSEPDKIKNGQVLILRKIDKLDSNIELDSKVGKFQEFITDSQRKNLEITVKSMSQKEQEAFWALSWMDDNWGTSSAGIGATFVSMGLLLGDEVKGNIGELKKLEALYQDYKSGRLRKGQYDYRRRKLLQKVAQKLGPTEKLLFNGKKAREAMRISKKGGLPPTVALQSNTTRLAKLSKTAAKGGTVLTVVNLGIACDQIARTNDELKKSEILVETAASTAVGVVGGVAITLFVAATPLGWVGALVLGAASSAVSYYSGKKVADLYKKYYSDVNVSRISGVSSLCSY